MVMTIFHLNKGKGDKSFPLKSSSQNQGNNGLRCTGKGLPLMKHNAIPIFWRLIIVS